MVFLEDKKSRIDYFYQENIKDIQIAILRIAPHAIIVHDGTGAIDQFKPMKMIEIKDLDQL